MANNYCESSSFLTLKKEQLPAAKVIIDRVIAELRADENEGYCGVLIDVEDTGVWFHTDESINVEHTEHVAKALVEELKIDEPFYCSWSYTCSKPRIDEFGGGAFVVQRGKDTFWVDAMCACGEYVERCKRAARRKRA